MAIASLATTFAETQTLTLDTSKMTVDQFESYKKLINSPSQQVSPKQVSEWATAGRELGGAFKECWGAISTDVERFANSPAGTWTAILVTWKVAGNDLIGVAKSIVRWIFSIGLAILFTAILLPMTWFNCVRYKKVLKSVKYDEKGKVIERLYDAREPIHADWMAAYAVVYCVFIGFCTIVAFA